MPQGFTTAFGELKEGAEPGVGRILIRPGWNKPRRSTAMASGIFMRCRCSTASSGEVDACDFASIFFGESAGIQPFCALGFPRNLRGTFILILSDAERATNCRAIDTCVAKRSESGGANPWSKGLPGAKGDPGPAGARGITGDVGPKGDRGCDAEPKLRKRVYPTFPVRCGGGCHLESVPPVSA
jgi:hypothetical protein